MVGHGACQKAVRVSGLKMMLGLVLSAPLGAPILDLQYLRVCKWSKMCNDDPKKKECIQERKQITNCLFPSPHSVFQTAPNKTGLGIQP